MLVIHTYVFIIHTYIESAHQFNDCDKFIRFWFIWYYMHLFPSIFLFILSHPFTYRFNGNASLLRLWVFGRIFYLLLVTVSFIFVSVQSIFEFKKSLTATVAVVYGYEFDGYEKTKTTTMFVAIAIFIVALLPKTTFCVMVFNQR